MQDITSLVNSYINSCQNPPKFTTSKAALDWGLGLRDQLHTIYNTLSQMSNIIKSTGDGTKFLADDGSYKVIPAPVINNNGSSSFTYSQDVASATWNIAHNMGFYPSVTVVDSSERVVIGDVTYNDANSLTVTFSAAFAGKAHLS